MRIFRFMKYAEFNKLGAYATINSPSGIWFHDGSENPSRFWCRAEGVLSDVVVEFEVTDPSVLDLFDTVYDLGPDDPNAWEAREYRATSYDREQFVPVRYGFVGFESTEWYSYN